MKLKPADRVLLLLSGTSVLTFFLLWIEPQLFHHDYWAERRLLCTLPLVFTACPLWLRWWSSPLQPQRTLASIGTGLALLLVCDFALQFNVKSYFGWEIDAGTRQVASIIAERHSKEKGGPVRVGVSSVMNESLNFYRLVRHMDWMAEVPRESAECYCDYYYVPSSELDHLKRFGVEEIYRNEVAGTVLAQPGDAARKRRAALKEVGFPNIPAGSVDLTLRESWAAAGHPGVRTHMLRDIMDGRETDSQFWTFEHPAFLFDVNNRTRLRFQLHLRLPAATYKIVGPVRLTVWVNTHQLGDELYTLPEDHTFDHAVPAEWLRPDGLTVVETKLDKYFIAPDDGQKLGYLFVAGGFVN